MKKRLSVSIDDKVEENLDNIMKKTNGRFRNRSHAIEKAIELLVEDVKNDKK